MNLIRTAIRLVCHATLMLLLCCGAAFARPVAHIPADTTEIHQKLIVNGNEKIVALTLDACGGAFDRDIIDTLIAFNIPATIFATEKWIDRNPVGVAMLRAHPALFAIEDHGAAHVPAVVGVGKRVYGIAGEQDLDHLTHEVEGGANAIAQTGAPRPAWYRGATAIYDQAAIEKITALGYQIAGFSLNADAGATLPRREIAQRVERAQNGDIIIAHMNKPASDSAEGLRDGLLKLKQQGFSFVTLEGRCVRGV